MQQIGKSNKGFKFLLCVIDIFSIYVWGTTVTNAFQKVFK